jgi:hypothetical protein
MGIIENTNLKNLGHITRKFPISRRLSEIRTNDSCFWILEKKEDLILKLLFICNFEKIMGLNVTFQFPAR